MTGINRAVLDDGSVLLTDAGASTGVTAGAVWVRGGSRAERDEGVGAAPLLKHLAFPARIGSSGKSALESRDRIGARPTAVIYKEHTAYSIPTRALDFDLDFQALARSHCSDHEEVFRETHRIIASIAAGNIGATECERCRQHLVAATAIGLEDSRVGVVRLASSGFYGPLRGRPEAGASALRRVTREDVIRAASDL